MEKLEEKEGEDVTLSYNVSGVPSPYISWINDRNEQIKTGPIWMLPSISTNFTGEYKCIASNACDNDNKTAVIV